MWGSYFSVPKEMFYLLKGDYRVVGFSRLYLGRCMGCGDRNEMLLGQTVRHGKFLCPTSCIAPVSR